MDDPWGSPWATPDGESDPKPPSPSKQHLELPRPTFAKLPSFSTHSPWGDEDDGFGDWASADAGSTTTTMTAAGNGWGGGWAGENGSNSSQQLTPIPRDEALERGSPIAWPGSIATSPGLNFKPVSRRASSVFRHPSPDPWATEFSLANDKPTTPTKHSEKAHTSQTHAINEHREVKPDSDSLGKLPQAVDEVDKELDGHTWREDIASNTAVGDIATGIVTQQSKTSGESGQETRTKASSAAQSVASRPSSPGSDDSHHHDDRQDSPITSIDEDSRSRLRVTRKVSNKVQELVEKFDALAKPKEDAPIARQERSRSRTPGPDIRIDGIDDSEEDEEEDEDADFGDFEDAIARQSRRPSVQGDTVTPSSPPPLPRPLSKGTAAQDVPLPESRPTTASESHMHGETPNLQKLVEKFGPIRFEVNSQDVDKLFDESKLAAVPILESDSYVPDYIVNDSFTDISERKTWYRISRQGTMRKHNLGDDENYKRITWSNSTARLDTIKIVRRWMEEDSISGRPTLGGSSSKGHGFGWDSGAEPVTLAQVFGKKRANAHAKSASAHQLRRPATTELHSPKEPLSPDVPSKPTPTEHQPSVTQSPSASFGWSAAPPGVHSTPTTTPAIAPIQETKDMKRELSTASTVPQARRVVQVPRPLSMPPPVGNPLSSPMSAPGAQEEEADEDDEWGDMVASPTDDQHRPNTSFQPTIPHISDFGNSIDAWNLNNPRASADSQPQKSVDDFAFSSRPSEAKQSLESTGSAFSSSLVSGQHAMAGVNSTQQHASSQDPWGFGDLSAFDSKMSSTQEPEKGPLERDSVATTASVSRDQPLRLSSEQSNTVHALARAPSLSSQADSDETVVVRRIIEGLPDFSYMLR